MTEEEIKEILLNPIISIAEVAFRIYAKPNDNLLSEDARKKVRHSRRTLLSDKLHGRRKFKEWELQKITEIIKKF